MSTSDDDMGVLSEGNWEHDVIVRHEDWDPALDGPARIRDRGSDTI